MDIRYFFSVLGRRKWLLMSSALLAAVFAWVLIGFLPKSYKSSASVATGLIEQKSIKVGEENVFQQEFEIQTKFDNMIELIKSRPTMDELTKRLMLHDFATDKATAFRNLKSDDLKTISPAEIDAYIAQLQISKDTFGIRNGDEINFLRTARKVEKALKYDQESLLKNFEIKRVDKSDNIRIEFKSEKADLSYYVVKTICNEYLNNYYRDKGQNTNISYSFYNNILNERKARLDSIMLEMNGYTQNQGIVALPEQSQTVVKQISDVQKLYDDEVRKLREAEQISMIYQKSQKNLTPRQADEYSSAVNNSKDIIEIDQNIRTLNERFVSTGLKDKKIKEQIDNLKKKREELSAQIARATRPQKDVVDDKEKEIYLKEIDANARLEAARQTATVYESRLKRLNGELSKLVGNNATFNRLQQQLEIAQAEYKAAAEKQDLAQINVSSIGQERPMRVVEPPLPADKPEKSNRVLMAAFAAVGTATVITLLLFLLIYNDQSLSNPYQIQRLVNIPVLGILNKLSPSSLNNFNQFFTTSTFENRETEFFKESLRRLRHDVESSGGRSFLFVSLKPNEGKSFLVAALAHALGLKNKKILLIDTNFKNNTLTSLTSSVLPKGDAKAQKSLGVASELGFPINLAEVDIIGNKGGHQSPSELLAGVDFRQKVDNFKGQYDYIFLEAASVSSFSDARELADFVDKVIPVFDATTKLKDSDREGVAFLRRLNGKLLGGVLNKADLKQI